MVVICKIKSSLKYNNYLFAASGINFRQIDTSNIIFNGV